MSHKSRRRKLRALHSIRLIPNILTLIALCAGLTALNLAITKQKFEVAVILIIIAAFIDGIDGRLARLLKSTSTFGAQLDSLADFFNFGVAPPIIMYMWATHNIKGWGWAAVLFFVVCAAIRLARFNTKLESEKKEPWMDRFFVGVPSPSAAVLSMAPMMLDFWLIETYGNEFSLTKLIPTGLVCLYMVIIALLMVSRIPTFSLKRLAMKPRFAYPIMVATAAVTIAIFTEPWLVIPLLCIGYFIVISFSVLAYNKLQKALKSSL